MKGEDTATLETPPKHKLFSERQLSPVLQRRLDSSKNALAPPAPIFNISLGKEISDLLHPAVHSSTSAPGPSHSPSLDGHLLPSSCAPGRDMPISEFCDLYTLGPEILEKFLSNKYKDARLLRFLTLADLKEMDFRLGEIAGLRDALELWSVEKST
jgi:hypothetical protein